MYYYLSAWVKSIDSDRTVPFRAVPSRVLPRRELRAKMLKFIDWIVTLLRCVLASAYEGMSIHLSVGPSIQWGLAKRWVRARGKRRLAWPNLLQGCLPNVITLAQNYRILHQCCLLLGRFKYTLSGPTAAFQEQYQHLLRLHPHWLLFWGPILTLRISPTSVNLASSYTKDLGNLTPQPQC